MSNAQRMPMRTRKMLARLENQVFAQWARGLLRLYYNQRTGDFDALIEKSLADGLKFDKEIKKLPNSQYPVRYYMFCAADGAVLNGMVVTTEKLLQILKGKTCPNSQPPKQIEY